MLECEVCGYKFNATASRHYITRDCSKTGLVAAIGSADEAKLYDTFDCPKCGCQLIIKERKRDYIPDFPEDAEDYYISEDEYDMEDDDNDGKSFWRRHLR